MSFMLSVTIKLIIMLRVVVLNVANKPILMSVVMPYVVPLSVVMPECRGALSHHTSQTETKNSCLEIFTFFDAQMEFFFLRKS
jgi:hypothetical protein